MSWIQQNLPRKGKTEGRYMFDGLFICQSVSKCKSILIRIILEWATIMMDKFWSNRKSSSGLIDTVI